MALSAFDEKTRQPRAAELRGVLGRSAAHWGSLIARIQADFAPIDESWTFAGAQWGWSLRLRHKKRTVLYMTPCAKHFVVGFALGEKAVEAAKSHSLPEAVRAGIDGAKTYAEGRAVRIEVRTKRDLAAVLTLAAAKMAH